MEKNEKKQEQRRREEFRFQSSISENHISREKYFLAIELAKRKYGSLAKFIVSHLKELLDEKEKH